MQRTRVSHLVKDVRNIWESAISSRITASLYNQPCVRAVVDTMLDLIHIHFTSQSFLSAQYIMHCMDNIACNGKYLKPSGYYHWYLGIWQVLLVELLNSVELRALCRLRRKDITATVGTVGVNWTFWVPLLSVESATFISDQWETTIRITALIGDLRYGSLCSGSTIQLRNQLRRASNRNWAWTKRLRAKPSRDSRER